ncbi:MAG: hypothetical protein ACYC1I_11700 [Acidimicrobiales bacterium]
MIDGRTVTMSATTVEIKSMARKKRDPNEPPPTVAVKLDRVLASRAKFIAHDMGVDLAKYLGALLSDPLDRDWAKIRKRMEEGK